jgi:hypothetical protein
MEREAASSNHEREEGAPARAAHRCIHHRATEKRHVISFNVTVGGSGDVPCIVAKIYDRRFPESMKEKPRVYNVGDNLFIMLLHSDTAETLVTSTQYKSCILPRCSNASHSHRCSRTGHRPCQRQR